MNVSRLVAKGLVVVLACGIVVPAWSQEADYAEGRVVRQDERSEELELEANVGWGEEELEGEKKLPWIPILSPTMICLDCWITKTLKIQDFYHQQAAQEHFAHSESCADLILCPDPCVGTALEYTLLAPIYAFRPHLLMRNCTCCGAGNPYGVPDPLPSVGVPSAQGPQVLTPLAAESPSAVGATSQVIPATTAPIGNPQVASGSKWASMSDREILDHFGLSGPNTQTVASDPFADSAVASGNWEFADQSLSTPAETLIAAREAANPTPAAAVAAPATSAPVQTSASDKLAAPREEASEEPRKTFSVTDEEYERMQDIEKGLLDLDGPGR